MPPKMSDQPSLQRSRARESAEGFPAVWLAAIIRAASTEPRSGERGGRALRQHHPRALEASTEPRSGERGGERDFTAAADAVARFNGAALGRARRGSCGRWRRRNGWRFNGAALGRARRG